MDKSWKFFKTVKFSTNVVLNKIGIDYFTPLRLR